MTDRIGKSLLAREALLAALEARQRDASAATPGGDAFSRELEASGVTRSDAGVQPAEEGSASESILDSLGEGLREVDASVRRAGALDEAVATGEIQDFHEIAVQLKQADLSFRFALEVRNRLIDAYREVMRLSV